MLKNYGLGVCNNSHLGSYPEVKVKIDSWMDELKSFIETTQGVSLGNIQNTFRGSHQLYKDLSGQAQIETEPRLQWPSREWELYKREYFRYREEKIYADTSDTPQSILGS